MLDALQLRMIPLTGTQQPMTFRFLVDTPFGFTVQELTLDIPDLPFALAELTRFVPYIWKATLGSALSSDIHCSIALVTNWKGVGGLQLVVPFVTQSGGQSLRPARQENSGCVVLHTGHADNFARRRVYLPGIPAAWSSDGLLNGAGKTGLYQQWAVMYMAFKGTELANPYRWLVAYPGIVESGTTNFFGVAFRQPEFFRISSHCARPPEGASLSYP